MYFHHIDRLFKLDLKRVKAPSQLRCWNNPVNAYIWNYWTYSKRAIRIPDDATFFCYTSRSVQKVINRLPYYLETKLWLLLVAEDDPYKWRYVMQISGPEVLSWQWYHTSGYQTTLCSTGEQRKQCAGQTWRLWRCHSVTQQSRSERTGDFQRFSNSKSFFVPLS